MASALRIEEHLVIPPIQSLSDFRRWALSDEFPQTGRIDYLAGHIEVDMSPEDLYMHGTLKSELIRVLANRMLEDDFGDIFSDCTRVSAPASNLSVEPDVVIISNEALDSGRVRLIPKATAEEDRFVEVEGAPDVVVEIVSDSSESKDLHRLPAAYFDAGVLEYWLIDARQDPLAFRIYRRGTTKFEAVRADGEGFKVSAVLKRQYRLDRHRNRFGRLRYELITKSE